MGFNDSRKTEKSHPFTTGFRQNTRKPKIYKADKPSQFSALSIAIALFLFAVTTIIYAVNSSSTKQTLEQKKTAEEIRNQAEKVESISSIPKETKETSPQLKEKCQDTTPKYGGNISWSCENEKEIAWHESFQDPELLQALIISFDLQPDPDNQNIFEREGILDSKYRVVTIDIESSTLTDKKKTSI